MKIEPKKAANRKKENRALMVNKVDFELFTKYPAEAARHVNNIHICVYYSGDLRKLCRLGRCHTCTKSEINSIN